MAITSSRIHRDVLGSAYIEIHDITFTGVTGGAVVTGLGRVIGSQFQPTSHDNHGIVYDNYSDTGSTAKDGTVYIDSVQNGGTGKLLVIGL